MRWPWGRSGTATSVVPQMWEPPDKPEIPPLRMWRVFLGGHDGDQDVIEVWAHTLWTRDGWLIFEKVTDHTYWHFGSQWTPKRIEVTRFGQSFVREVKSS